MKLKKFAAIILTVCLAGLAAAGCGQSGDSSAKQDSDSSSKQDSDSSASQTETTVAVVTNLSKPEKNKWKYLENGKLYYQLGIDYCEKPADERYEKLSVFVPAEYMDATANGDGTYTCELKGDAKSGSYTAADAPIVMPIETTGYYAAEALTDDIPAEALGGLFEQIAEYTSQGMVYVHPGCRGIEEGAPAGVTDLKAAVRYVRYCDDVLPGDAERIFAFGLSGGGAQAAVLGASGNSELYEPYLTAIGAVQGASDAVAGVMSWCPITSLDTANAEYEWMMGCTRGERSPELKQISDELAKAFGEYINKAGFTDKNGSALTLTESKEGIYQAGSYYDYIKGVIEGSLNNYLSDTDFADPEMHNSFGSAQAYIDSLNKENKWVTYDKSTNTAKITSIADFAKACKNASSTPLGFDAPQGQNTLFGFGDGKGTHFDRLLGDILAKMNSEFAYDFAVDLKKTDAQGNTVEQRVQMYAPLYYLMENREGYGTATVAPYWRIRSGIEQFNTSVTTEANLALALENYDGVKDVDFETVWEQGHDVAERTGDSTENFIQWVNSCMK